ncbi:MAG TPA: TIR domain-containing protein, partial [Verrucomicrobia bacterium]|nr:TIR domain-containing protein [Verrucomicrobiota bacterium]
MHLDTDVSSCLNSRPQVSPDVFISYSREDQQQVVKMVEYLRGQGISVWMDETDI